MSVLDDLMVATQHLIGWEEGAAELARLRRMADLLCAEYLDRNGRNGPGRYCRCCKRNGPFCDVLVHRATCDVAIHLGLPREMEGE